MEKTPHEFTVSAGSTVISRTASTASSQPPSTPVRFSLLKPTKKKKLDDSWVSLIFANCIVTMTLLQSLFHLTNFNSPLLQTIVPSIAAAFSIQATFAIPSIIAQTERFYDFSGSLTFLSVTALSLYLPALRARYATGVASGEALPTLLSPFLAAGGTDGLNWRQVALSGAVAIWAIRCM